MAGSQVLNTINYLQKRIETYTRVAHKPSTPKDARLVYLKLVEDFRCVIAILNREPFKLTDEHESKIKPFILGLVWDDNGEERAADFELPFTEIQGIFNQVVDNLNE